MFLTILKYEKIYYICVQSTKIELFFETNNLYTPIVVALCTRAGR